MSMKNYVILLAGGVGKRMQTDIPKQFIVVEGRPILVHTAERFQCNPQIESIVIVCVAEWIDNLRSLVEKYSLTKVRWIIEGGSTGHDSIRNGVFFLKDKIDSDDYIVVHDAVRDVYKRQDLIQTAGGHNQAGSRISGGRPAGDALLNKGTVSASGIKYVSEQLAEDVYKRQICGKQIKPRRRNNN